VSDPGGTKPGAPGRATDAGRIMQVFLRTTDHPAPQWNLAAWGKTNQSSRSHHHAAGGGFATGLGCTTRLTRSPQQDIDAMMHFWRYVGT